MKPQRFEIGQAVTPNRTDFTFDEPASKKAAPRFGKIYHVFEYGWGEHLNRWYVELEEIRGYEVAEFALDPIITDSELACELESIEVPQEV